MNILSICVYYYKFKYQSLLIKKQFISKKEDDSKFISNFEWSANFDCSALELAWNIKFVVVRN